MPSVSRTRHGPVLQVITNALYRDARCHACALDPAAQIPPRVFSSHPRCTRANSSRGSLTALHTALSVAWARTSLSSSSSTVSRALHCATREPHRFFTAVLLTRSPVTRDAASRSPDSAPSRSARRATADGEPSRAPPLSTSPRKQRRSFQHRRGAAPRESTNTPSHTTTQAAASVTEDVRARDDLRRENGHNNGRRHRAPLLNANSEEVHTDFSDNVNARKPHFASASQTPGGGARARGSHTSPTSRHPRQRMERQHHPQSNGQAVRQTAWQSTAGKRTADRAEGGEHRGSTVRAPRASAVPAHNVLEHLLRTHDTARQNYAALKKDARVVEAFSHLCLEAVRETLDALIAAGHAQQAAASANDVGPSVLRVFFHASTQTTADEPSLCACDIRLSSSSSVSVDALVAPLRVPPLPASEFFESLARATTAQSHAANNHVGRCDDELTERVQRTVDDMFVKPLTQMNSTSTVSVATSTLDAEANDDFFWPYHDALHTQWLTPSSVRPTHTDLSSPSPQNGLVEVDASLSSPAAREAWRRERAHALVELLNTVVFFKWAKDENAFTSNTHDASAPRLVADHLDAIREARHTLRRLRVELQSLPDGAAGRHQRMALAQKQLQASQQVLTHAQAIVNAVPKVDETVPTHAQQTADPEGRAPSMSTSVTSMHVFDALLMLLLRALLPLWPTATLSHPDKAVLFRISTLPWFAGTRDPVCLPLARWLVYIQLATSLPSCSPALLTNAARDTPDGHRTPRAPLEGELQSVQLLRLLCWPTLLDEDSSIVDRALGSGSSSSATTPSAPLKELLAVVSSSEARQRLAYNLLYLLFFAQQVPQRSTETSKSERVTIAPHLLRSTAVYVRSVSALCVYVMDADRFMSERFSGLPEPCALLYGPSAEVTSTSNRQGVDHAVEQSPGARAQRQSLRADLERQAEVPGALTRRVLLTLPGPDLAALWSAMPRKRAVWLWEAYLRAVGPLCAVLCQGALIDDARRRPHGHFQDARLDAVWQCLAPLRAQLMDSPTLRKVLMPFFMESVTEATRRAAAFTERGITADPAATIAPTTTTRTAPTERAEEEAAIARLTAAHIISIACVGALLFEAEEADTATRPAAAVLHEEVRPKFERCVRAYLQQPPPLSPPASSKDRVDAEAEATLVRFSTLLGGSRRATSSEPQERQEEEQERKSRYEKRTDTDADRAYTTAAAMLAHLTHHLLTPSLCAEVRLTTWQREQAAQRRQCEKPADITHPVLRQWHERLRESEVSGLHGAFPVNAASVYATLLSLLLPNEPAALALTLDELHIIFDVLVHLHTRAGLQLMRSVGRHTSSSSSSSGAHYSSRARTRDSVFDLMAQAVYNESIRNAQMGNGADNTTASTHTKSTPRLSDIEANIDRMEHALVAQLHRAMTGKEAVDDARRSCLDASDVRRVPLTLWLDAVALGLVSIVSLQPGLLPTTASNSAGVPSSLFAAPRDFFLRVNSKASPCARNHQMPSTDTDGAAARAPPSLESWLDAFDEDFRQRRTVRLTAGLVFHRNTPLLKPSDGGWHGCYLDNSETSALVHCERVLSDGVEDEVKDSAAEEEENKPEPDSIDSTLKSTQSLLRLLQHALMQSELAEAAQATTNAPLSAPIGDERTHTSPSSLSGTAVPSPFTFAEEDGMKEPMRGYTRLYTVTTFLQVAPHTCAAEERCLYALLIRVLSDLKEQKPSVSPSHLHSQGSHRLTSDALLALAVATQRVTRTGALEDADASDAENQSASASSSGFVCAGADGDDDHPERRAERFAGAVRGAVGSARGSRLPPISPTRHWVSSIELTSHAADKEDASDDARQSSCATLRQRLAEAFREGHDADDREERVTDSSHGSLRPLRGWLSESPSLLETSVLRRAAIEQCAYWLSAALDELTSVHTASAGALLSARDVVAVLAAVSALRNIGLVPVVVADEVTASCARVLHHLTESRRLAARDTNLFVTAALVAPETSTCLVHVALHVRDARDQLSLVEVVRALAAMTVAARTFEAQHDAQADRQAEEVAASAEMPMVLMTPSSASTPTTPTPTPTPPATSKINESAAPPASAAPAGPSTASGRTPVPLPGTLADRCSGRLPSVPSGRHQPPALRSTWLSLSRRLLSREVKRLTTPTTYTDACVESHRWALLTAAWSHALLCGAALGCADSAVFGQLMATLIFSQVDERAAADDDEGAPKTHSEDARRTFISHLSLADWSRVLCACRSAPDIDRDELAEMLREPLLDFVTTVAQTPFTGYWQDACIFVEALPSLFVESQSFWERVRVMITHVCEEVARSSAPCVAVEACCQSFNWAVQSTGHASLRMTSVPTCAAPRRNEGTCVWK